MPSKYNLVFADGSSRVYARKDAAIANGEKANQPFQVWTVPGGKIVHDAMSDVGNEIPSSEEPEVEDLIGDVETEVEDDDTPVGSKKFDVAALKRKIALLLAKAERTDSEAERIAFNTKAEKMMLRLGINAAELEAAGEVKPEDIVEVTREYNGGYALTMTTFVNQVCIGFGNLTVLKSGRGSHQRVYIIGHRSDVKLANQLLDSLEMQAMSALHIWQRTAPERAHQDNNARYVGSKSFLAGYSMEVGERLLKLRAETESEASTGAALVLASKQERVNDWVSQNKKVGKGRGGNSSFSSLAAGAGRTAGKTANLGEKSVGGSKRALA